MAKYGFKTKIGNIITREMGALVRVRWLFSYQTQLIFDPKMLLLFQFSQLQYRRGTV